MEEGKESEVKGTGNIFNKITEETFTKEEDYQITRSMQNTKTGPEKVLVAHSNQNTECTKQRKNFKSSKRKYHVTYKGKPIWIIPNFLMKTLKYRRA